MHSSPWEGLWQVWKRPLRGRIQFRVMPELRFGGMGLRIMILFENNFVSRNERGFLLILSHWIFRTNAQARCLVSFFGWDNGRSERFTHPTSNSNHNNSQHLLGACYVPSTVLVLTWVIHFNLHNSPMKLLPFLQPLYRWGIQAEEFHVASGHIFSQLEPGFKSRQPNSCSDTFTMT